jgi:hypothetical protein
MPMNRKIKISAVALLILFSLAGCTYFENNNCSRHMERRKMVNVLTDVYILEAQLSQNPGMYEMRDSIPFYYAGIFEKHAITPEQFDKALECYLLDEENMVWIMDEVLSTMSIIQGKMDEKRLESE